MTEAGWLRSRDPWEMFDAIRSKLSASIAFSLQLKLKPRTRKAPRTVREPVSDRKARLYAVACCRTLGHLLTAKHCRKAVEVSEQFADGLASKAQLSLARKQFPAATRSKLREQVWTDALAEGLPAEEANARAVAWAVGWDIAHSATRARAWDAAFLCQLVVHVRFRGSVPEASATLCGLLREVFGNPFGPVEFDPFWRTANVVELAWTIYEKRAFERLPILADALLDAGCTNDEVLSHCRSEGPHARGCWAVDLVLGKE